MLASSAEDRQARQYLNTILKAAKEMPCIYVRVFVKKSSLFRAPTARQMLACADWALVYAGNHLNWTAEDIEAVYQVEYSRDDTITEQDVEDGERRLLGEKKGTSTLQKIKVWATAIKTNIEALSSQELDQPLARPPAYTGYAMSYEHRFKAHKSGLQGTSIFNWVLFCYFEAVHGYGVFDFEDIPVVLIGQKDQAPIAEVVIAGLIMSQCRFGGLNNAHCGGMGKNLDDIDWSDYWRTVMAETPAMKNFQIEEARIKKYYRVNHKKKDYAKMEKEIHDIKELRENSKKELENWATSLGKTEGLLKRLLDAGESADSPILCDLKTSAERLRAKIAELRKDMEAGDTTLEEEEMLLDEL